MADIDSDVHLDEKVLLDFWNVMYSTAYLATGSESFAKTIADDSINDVLNAGLLIRRRSRQRW